MQDAFLKDQRPMGNFSRITLRFEIEREFGHFLLDIYVPSILFVVTSWLSFWVEIPAAPARVTLSMTTMLTLVTSEKAIREKLPKVSYVHALDIWNVVCTGMSLVKLSSLLAKPKNIMWHSCELLLEEM